MDPQTLFCPNLACPARGQVGQGNLTIHSRKEQRYRCQICRKTFAARTGTVFYRRRTPEAIITQVLTLVSYGCPIVAIEAAFQIQAQTVREWVEVAGTHAEAVHYEQIVQPRDLRHVQADELRLKTQCGIIWMAMAMMVSTRLWLGGVISTRRDQALIDRLVQIIAACAVMGPLLVAVDGLRSYVDAIRRTFPFVLHTGRVGQTVDTDRRATR